MHPNPYGTVVRKNVSNPPKRRRASINQSLFTAEDCVGEEDESHEDHVDDVSGVAGVKGTLLSEASWFFL
jgi:hypothetical protein